MKQNKNDGSIKSMNFFQLVSAFEKLDSKFKSFFFEE